VTVLGCGWRHRVQGAFQLRTVQVQDDVIDCTVQRRIIRERAVPEHGPGRDGRHAALLEGTSELRIRE
jgi:hypothetical protein